MFGFKSIRQGISSFGESAVKFNETVHGSAAEAAKTVTNVKAGATGALLGKGAVDCVISHQCNDMVCFIIYNIGTTADVSSFVCGNLPGLKKVTPATTFISFGCKSFVRLCRTGNITFSCKDPS